MKKTLYTIIAMMFFAPSIYASHVGGAELRYEYNGTNYTVILDIYAPCARNVAGFGNTANVDVISNLLNDSTRLVLPEVKRDTVTMPCLGNSVCYVPSSTNPGFIKLTYKDTITLAASSDWKFTYSIGARPVNVNNLAPSSQLLYVEAELDNVNGPNSSPFIPNFMFSNIYKLSTNVTVPLQTIDPDGDSIVYEIVTPKTNKVTNITYPSTGGYSATTPMGTGGVYTINAANQTMTLRSNNQGVYAMAFKVKEYRNGVLIGTYVRDFSVSFFVSNSNMTYPRLSFNSMTTVYACPGATDSSIVWFTDPFVSDSVSVTVHTPTMAGWSFGSATAAGAPTATAHAWWTAPAGLNPATTPFFYITYRVADNGCPSAMADYAILVKTRQCNADSVWPGDANADKVVNLLDPLAIALAYNETGPARLGATISWVAQGAPDWNGNIALLPVNKKHADCNGDGTVALADLGAVAGNYGKTHPKGGARQKITGAPEVFFDMSGITLRPGITVDVPIKMGTAANAINDVYGIASRINISETPPTTQATISTATSWLGNGANSLTFEKKIELGVIDWVHARTNHSNANGSGVIGTLNYTVPATAKPGDSVRFSFEHIVVVNKDGDLITNYNATDVVAYIQFPASVQSIPSSLLHAAVVPNPSGNTANLHLQLAAQSEVTISIVDVTGKTVWASNHQAQKGNNQIALPAAQVANGVYFINIQAANGATHKLKWAKR